MRGQETIGANGDSFVLFGTLEFATDGYPAMNRRAVFCRPCGTGFRSSYGGGKWFVASVLVVLCGISFAPAAGGKPPSGQQVYKQECARCHGKSGEGVKGKYDEALRGDRTLEKLTRYIERAMPDDNPGKC